MKINYSIGTIHLFVFITQSLLSMNINVTNIVPDIVAPIGIGCTQNGIAVLEKDSFTVWNIEKQKNIIKQNGSMRDFAINEKGTLVALSYGRGIQNRYGMLSGRAYVKMYDACSGEQQWCRETKYLYFLPIVFNHNDEVVTHQRRNHQSIIYRKPKEEVIYWPGIASNANESFAHHPFKEQIIFEFKHNIGFCANYTQTQNNYHFTFDLLLPDSFFVVGQLYNNDGSYLATVSRGKGKTSIAFETVDSMYNGTRSLQYINLQKICIAMAFHPNNKLFFLLDENNIIDCFYFKTKQCIHSLCCDGQEKIPVNRNRLEKRLALSRDGNTLYAALKDKVVAIAIDEKNEKKQLFFMLWMLGVYNESLLPSDVIHVIMDKALKVSNAPLWNYLDKN